MSDLVRRAITTDGVDFEGDVAMLRELAEEAPVVELVSNTLSQAVNEGASDIHVEPREHEFDIRYRIDGVLQSRLTLPRSRFDAVASRIKLISGLDIAERRLPQDGRIGTRISGRELDIRVSCLPGVWGESIVMRLLMKEQKQFSLAKIGTGGRSPRLPSPSWREGLWHHPGYRPHRFGQIDHAESDARAHQGRQAQDHHRRRSGGIQHPRRDPGADQSRDRLHLCPRIAPRILRQGPRRPS